MTHSGDDSCEPLAIAGLGLMKCLLGVDGSQCVGGGVVGNLISSVSPSLSDSEDGCFDSFTEVGSFDTCFLY